VLFNLRFVASARNVGVGAALLSLGACAVNEAPSLPTPVPVQWENGATGREPYRFAEAKGWWLGYRDPILSGLIDRALAQSPTLEQALARIESARALARSEGASRFPQVGGSGNVDLTRRLSGSAEGLNEGGESNGQGSRRAVGTFQAGFDATWEVDLFGRVRNAIASAQRNAEAIAEDAETARVTLIAEIVRTYVELRAAELRRGIIGNDIAARQRLVQLVQSQKSAGLAADFDVQRAVAVAETAKARLPTADLAIRTARHRLATLIGEPAPDRALARSVSRVPIIRPPRPTFPADLVRTRPEIRAAERNVARRAADVGVATAELYPRLTLSGTLTIAGNVLARPLPGQLVTVAGGPALTIPLLDWGQRRAIVDAREADLREAVAGYRAAVLQGVEEVEVSLASIRNQNARIARLQSAVSATYRAYETADALYKQGLTGLTERLTAEAEWRQAELELADAREAAGIAVVRLYKALGAPRFDLERTPTVRSLRTAATAGKS
jgi:NodT family efflux transporter outer membrane factor (OMF) lipoprotein